MQHVQYRHRVSVILIIIYYGCYTYVSVNFSTIEKRIVFVSIKYCLNNSITQPISYVQRPISQQLKNVFLRSQQLVSGAVSW